MGDINITFNFYDDSEANFVVGEDVENDFEQIEGEIVDCIEENIEPFEEYDCFEAENDAFEFDYEYDESSEEWVYFDDLND